MISTLLLLALPLPAAPASATFSAAALPPVLLQDADLKDKFKEFDKILKGDGGEPEAIGMIDEFTKDFRVAELEYSALDLALEFEPDNVKEIKTKMKALAKTKAAIAETVFKCIYHKNRKAITKDNLNMWKAAAYSLGQMGPDGAGYLWKIFEDKKKKFRKEPDYLGLCLEQIGYTHAYEEYTEKLVDLLDHHEYLFIAKAAEALVQFQEAPGELRHEATETMVKLLAEYYEATITDKEDIEAQEKYRKVGRSLMNALEALTGVSQSQPLDWVKWWNDHKKKNDDTWVDA
jgi:hypothetical protein